MVKKKLCKVFIIAFFVFSFCNGVSGIKHWGKEVVDYLHGLSSDLSKTYVSIGNVEWTIEEMKSKLKEFALLYNKRPIKDNAGGMNSSHMFHVWFIVKHFKPKYIIESGIWKGQSTWLLEQAAPNAKIISLDPHMNNRVYISKKVTYSTKDFSKIDWSHLDKDNTLCFFDDHQGTIRIKQCHEFGFKHIIYEDNFPHWAGNFIPNAISPKYAFLEEKEKADYLYSVLSVYYECPPIYPDYTNARFNWCKFKHITSIPLLFEITDNLFEIYRKDAWAYTWIAYMQVKD